jgi:predicted MFS family arabinose efflux permease
LSFGVLGGLSASMLFNPAISAIGHWFSARRGLATGVACTAGGIGGVLFSIVILYMAPDVGFGWSMRAIALLSLVSCGLACIFLKKRLPPNKRAGAAIDLKALKEPKFAATTAAVFLVEFAVFIPYTYISSYAIHKGMDPKMAYLINVFLNAGAIPGRALPGYVADRFGTFNTMCLAAFVCTAFVLGLWLPMGALSEPMVMAFAVLYGFWSGAAISLTPVCVGQMCNTEDYGKRNGTAFSLTSIGVLVGVPIAGAVLQANDGSYHGLIILGGVVYALAVGMFAVARGIATNWVLWVRF